MREQLRTVRILERLTHLQERMAEMKNSYETAGVVELGKAERTILGMKFLDPFGCDYALGPGFSCWLIDDIDESDE